MGCMRWGKDVGRRRVEDDLRLGSIREGEGGRGCGILLRIERKRKENIWRGER